MNPCASIIVCAKTIFFPTGADIFVGLQVREFLDRNFFLVGGGCFKNLSPFMIVIKENV